ncbi:UvrD-helicase domain-containing protein [Candidatus Magnetominusculus xianensis]|uniref:DNA 3'-5' helicase n=1 Tax=Candidatus Magnetominusculus xianensis TaxID=1748249 RepID=A0ABR5SD38_9BACT|nr:UvrD-helicase domain-containing protein [Candidatus Magnetominusculus xianensis]KWT82659.1 UvrD/REP helicase [Candidatus Magnetominusculus xianensis]MBF0405330.1 UvrD-helicase domain-containing protein [Nitrospirota bacterium]
MDVIEKDDTIAFPHTIILKASAGSGKTHALTKRFVQFLLSEKVPHNGMKNIMAVTFSNNAAKEMKERILQWLKDIYFGDQPKRAELLQCLSIDEDTLLTRTTVLIDEILDNYTDFHVKTIDSFMASVFKASVIDLGYNQDFEIQINGDALMDYAFELFLRKVKEGTKEGAIVENAVSLLLESRQSENPFLWDPSKTILSEIKKIYRKLASTGKRPRILALDKEISGIKNSIKETVDAIEDAIERSGLQRRGNSSYKNILHDVRAGNFSDILGTGTKNPPVNKPGPKAQHLTTPYDHICDMWSALTGLISRYAVHYAHTYYTPYIRIYEEFYDTLVKVKKHYGAVFIEDINMMLAGYITSEIVPDVYFRIGETIYHYLIDEYQDTSPIQWKNLYPLIENSTSQGGSLFAVGDTKQAIYGFRDADYSIMKRYEEESPFPSAEHFVRELDTNFRSLQRILNFNDTVFKHTLPKIDSLCVAAMRSGLTDFTQKVRPGNENSGHVEVTVLEKSLHEDGDDMQEPEKLRFISIVEDLIRRGYNLSDIAVITKKNDDVLMVASWLDEITTEKNRRGIPFISFSSLDVRKSKITGELISLLNFLDSPIDDLSFVTFCTGEIFSAVVDEDKQDISMGEIKEFFLKNRSTPPLYKAFQREYAALWETYFDGLFRAAGFFPLYDLVSEIYRVFKVFNKTVDESEAVLARVLEAVKDFEDKGSNNLRDFLSMAHDEDSSASGADAWTIDVPTTTDAIRIMTVHKAKGLGFPVVIVLVYDESNKGLDYVAYETPDGINLLKLNEKILKSISVTDPDTYELLFREERIKDTVNRLNTLYVAMTRAKSELYVIAVEGRAGKGLFREVSAPPNEKPPVIVSTKSGSVDGQFHLHHDVARPSGLIYTEQSLNVMEKKRGDFIHRCLSFIDFIDDNPEGILDSLIALVNSTSAFKFPSERTTLSRFLKTPFIVPYFTKGPGTIVKKEQTFSNSQGALLVMDRVVIVPDLVTVIDFKTGSKKSEGYVYQLRGYINLLQELYPASRVEGIIAYVDLLEGVTVI